MIFDTVLPKMCQENIPCKYIEGLIKLKFKKITGQVFNQIIYQEQLDYMIPGFEALVEERIKKAQKDGAFENLKGKNKPLKFEDQHIPAELRLAYKILKNSGFLPPELELKKKISQTEQLLEITGIDSPKRNKIQKKLNYLLTKLNTIRGDRPMSPLLTDVYRNNIIKKIS